MQHILDFFHNGRNAACIVEELCRPLSCGTDVQQIMCASVESVKGIAVDLNAEFPCNSREVEQGVCGAGDCSVHHDGVLKGLHGHDLVRCQIMLCQPY